MDKMMLISSARARAVTMIVNAEGEFRAALVKLRNQLVAAQQN